MGDELHSRQSSCSFVGATVLNYYYPKPKRSKKVKLIGESSKLEEPEEEEEEEEEVIANEVQIRCSHSITRCGLQHA